MENGSGRQVRNGILEPVASSAYGGLWAALDAAAAQGQRVTPRTAMQHGKRAGIGQNAAAVQFHCWRIFHTYTGPLRRATDKR